MRMQSPTMNGGHYRKLLLMVALSFLAMYGLMYAMVDQFANVYNNLNQVYMAGLMTAPMVVIELLLMGAMYENKRLNLLLVSVSLIMGALCFTFIRQQAGITDKQFLRSMIPHHASAILMCEQAPSHDAEIQQLCRQITAGQQSEIKQMKHRLSELDQ